MAERGDIRKALDALAVTHTDACLCSNCCRRVRRELADAKAMLESTQDGWLRASAKLEEIREVLARGLGPDADGKGGRVTPLQVLKAACVQGGPSWLAIDCLERQLADAKAALEALARDVGQALLVPTLEPGESFVEPSEHAIVQMALGLRSALESERAESARLATVLGATQDALTAFEAECRAERQRRESVERAWALTFIGGHDDVDCWGDMVPGSVATLVRQYAGHPVGTCLACGQRAPMKTAFETAPGFDEAHTLRIKERCAELLKHQTVCAWGCAEKGTTNG